MAESFGGTFATVLSTVAVCVSTWQAWISWEGRNSHIALNLHSEQMRACASVSGRIPRLLTGVSAFAARDEAAKAWGTGDEVTRQRQDMERVRGELMESLELLSMIADEALADQAQKLALNVQNIINNFSDARDLSVQHLKDLRDGLAVETTTFVGSCRERLRSAGA